MRLCRMLAFMVFLAATIASPASVLLFLTSLGEMDRQQQPHPPGDSQGKLGASPEAADPKPNPDSSGKYHVGDGVSPPKIVFAPDPEFTDKARRKKLNGTVVVSLTVDSTGKPQDVRVLRSLAEGVSKKLRPAALSLDESALKAAKEYRFEPADFEGTPVPVEVKIEINYRIY